MEAAGKQDRFEMEFPASQGLPWWLSQEESACSAGDHGATLGSGRSPGEGNGGLLQYSHLENPMDREACQATIRGIARSQT